MAKKGTKAETIVRAQKFAEIIANGGRRSDCVRYASETWGVGERSVDSYLNLARENLKKDFDSDMDTRDIYYDTGYMVSLCVAIGKVELGQKLHDKFLLH